MKFKIGDKVKLRKDLRNYERYAMEDSLNADSYIDMDMRFDGATTVIGYCGGKYTLAAHTSWNYTDGMLLPADDNRKIVVTTDGKETLARLYEDDKVVKKATARCSPDDEFNFETGARIALSRLIPGESKYLTGTVVCLESGTTDFTVGKLYKVNDGVIKNNFGQSWEDEKHLIRKEEKPKWGVFQDVTFFRVVED